MITTTEQEPTTDEYRERMNAWERAALESIQNQCPITASWPDPDLPFDEYGYCCGIALHRVDAICPKCGPMARAICAYHYWEAKQGERFNHRTCGRTPITFIWLD